MNARKSILRRYRQLGIWAKIGVWGSVASIGSLAWLFVPQSVPRSQPGQAVTASAGATVIQSGRDVVINPPALPPPSTKGASESVTILQPPAAVQTMTNSPGGIQAGGNVIVTASDKKLINAITLHIAIETDTPACSADRRAD